MRAREKKRREGVWEARSALAVDHHMIEHVRNVGYPFDVLVTPRDHELILDMLPIRWDEI